MIVELCKKVGLKARSHDASWESGAGSGHKNAIVEADGVIYECDAGYTGDAPRHCSIIAYTDGYRYQNNTDGTVKLLEYETFDENQTVITVPSTLDGKPVTGIKRSIFFDVVSVQEYPVEKIILPSTITSLGKQALYTVTKQVTYEMAETTSDSIRIKDGLVLSSDEKTLYYCMNGKTGSVSVPATVTKINDYAFCYCQNLTSATLPEGVTSIGYASFWNCTSLEEVNIPATVTSVGSGAFDSDKKAVIKVYSNNAAYGEYAFADVSKVIGYAGSTAQTQAATDNVSYETF